MKDKLINTQIIQWLKERDEVLKTHDVNMFKEFVIKWRKRGFYDDTPFPSDEVLEASMRKMICNIPTMSQKEKKEAEEWLTSRGYTPEIWRF
jgi:hypothetical protein